VHCFASETLRERTSGISVYISPNELAEAANNVDHTLPARFKGRLLRFPAAFPLNSEEICRDRVMSVSIHSLRSLSS